MTSPAERRRIALAVLSGRSAAEVAAEWGVEPELVARWVELFDEGGQMRLAGLADPRSFEARDRFLVLVAHEFRTPLTVIKGWVETLQRRDVPPEVRDEALAVVLHQVDNLERIARNALDAGAAVRNQLQLQVAPLELRGLLARVAGDTAVIEQGPPVVVVADAARIEQVAGDVLAHAARVATARPPAVSVDAAGDDVTVRVSAVGRTLTFDEAADLFEPYARSDTSVGTGLGLFVCRALLAAHGGEIGLRSSGEASTFWFRLPKAGPTGGPLVERVRR